LLYADGFKASTVASAHVSENTFIEMYAHKDMHMHSITARQTSSDGEYPCIELAGYSDYYGDNYE